jgi:hypothetical protein
MEYEYWSVENQIYENASKEKEIRLNEETISGVYQYSDHQIPNNYPSHIYKDSQGKRFATDPNGTPVFYFWGNPQNNVVSSRICSEQQCLAIAQDFLSNFVNVDEYEVTTETDSQEGIYEITFTKWLNGYPTTDHATVTVKSDGSLYSYSSFMLGRLPTTSTVKFDLELAKQSVYQKIDKIYDSVRGEYTSITCDEPIFEYTILENGATALFCVVDVQCKLPNGGDTPMYLSERVLLIIELW